MGTPSLLHRLKRALRAFRTQAHYEGSDLNRIRQRRPDTRSADTIGLDSQRMLMGRARDSEANDDITNGLLNTLVQKCIGTGIRPEPQIKLVNGDPAAEFTLWLMDQWDRWAEAPSVTGEHSMAALQRLEFRTWLRDGDVFRRFLAGNVRGVQHATPDLPLALQLIESQSCPIDYNDPAKRIVAGVEKTVWSKPIAFFFYRSEVSDIASRTATWRHADPSNLQRVPAANIAHLKMVKRVAQTRGISHLASAINRVADVKEIDEAERIAARIAASLCAYIRKGSPTEYDSGRKAPREIEMYPGMVIDDLVEGEEIATIGSSRPNPELVPFRESQLRTLAASLGTAFSSSARKYDTSYSATRQEAVDVQGAYEILAQHWAALAERPTWRQFVPLAWMSAPAELRRGIDPDSIFDVTFSSPITPWIDPLKEMQADILALTGGDFGVPLTTWADVVRKRGKIPQRLALQIREQEQVLAQIRADEDPEAPGAEAKLRVIRGQQ